MVLDQQGGYIKCSHFYTVEIKKKLREALKPEKMTFYFNSNKKN